MYILWSHRNVLAIATRKVDGQYHRIILTIKRLKNDIFKNK